MRRSRALARSPRLRPWRSLMRSEGAARWLHPVGGKLPQRSHHRRSEEQEGQTGRSSRTQPCATCASFQGPCTSVYRGFKVHGACRNAIRAYYKVLDKTKDLDLKKKCDGKFFTDIEAWHRAIVPMIVPEGSKRTCQQRGQAKLKLEEEYTTVEHHRDTVYYTQQAFIAYNMFWERLIENEAHASWLEQLDAASDHENSDGEPVVGVLDHPRKRRITGKRSLMLTSSASASSSLPAHFFELSASGGTRDAMEVSSGEESGRERYKTSSDDEADEGRVVEARGSPQMQARVVEARGSPPMQAMVVEARGSPR